MNLNNPNADVYVPDGLEITEALARTTHMGIGAHQDDLEVFAYAGIAACYQKQDKWFSGVTVTDGAGSSRTGLYADYSDEDMKAVRIKEQRKAAYLGEYAAIIQTLHPSSLVKDGTESAVVNDLSAILLTARPDVLYLHNPADKHDTHIAVFLRTLAALRKLPIDARPKQTYGVEVWRDLDWMCDEDKQFMIADERPNMADALMSLFDSQITGGKRYDRALRGRREANATFFDSHSSDEMNAVNWAMDLNPLVLSDDIDTIDFTIALIEKFKADVQDRIERMS